MELVAAQAVLCHVFVAHVDLVMTTSVDCAALSDAVTGPSAHSHSDVRSDRHLKVPCDAKFPLAVFSNNNILSIL